MLGIYLHVPFCRRKCDYCDFYSVCDAENALMDRYAAAVAAHACESAAVTRDSVDTVYFGGGTPTVLGAERLARLLRTLKKCFAVDKDAEITVEANPESCDPKLLKRLRRAGFNRLSLGVQSSDDDELSRLGRLHSFAEACEAVSAARTAKFENISIDLMFGIEGQTTDSWRRTLDDAIRLNPDHISAYGLTVEEGTPLAVRGARDIADDDGQAEMYKIACELLRRAGFEHYEISNWCRPGCRARHNSRYWRLEPYVGFGPAAHSDCGGKRYSVVRDIDGYVRGIADGGAVLDDCYEVSPAERGFEYVMLGLRTSDGIDEETLRRQFRLDPDTVGGVVDRLAERGLMERGNGRLWLTEDGFLLSNSVILEVSDSLKPLVNRFAR